MQEKQKFLFHKGDFSLPKIRHRNLEKINLLPLIFLVKGIIP